MKIEDQFASLELSKRLKDLGVKQESLFSWTDDSHGTFKISLAPAFLGPIPGSSEVSAFTVAELGEILRDKIIGSFFHGGIWFCEANDRGLPEKFDADTEADARAQMLICLIEKKLVNPIEANIPVRA